VRRILLLFSRAWKAQSSDSINSGCFEALACYGWSLYVGLHRFPACCTTQPSLSSWEFFTTLDCEWEVIRGRLPYRWTIWVSNNRCFNLLFIVLSVWANLFIRQIYSLARVAALLGVIFCITIMDITTPINCQVGTVFYVYSLAL
jgi:hypothetical protein